MESASGGAGAVSVVVNETSDGSLDDFYESGEGASMLLFEFILHGIFTNLIGVVGLAGNVVCIAILSRPQMRSSINLILCTLSCFDIVVIATSMMMFSFPAVYRYARSALFFAFYYRVLFPYLMPFVYPLALIAQTGSVYTTLAVTIERYIVICWPLRSEDIITYGRTKISILVTVLFSVLYNVPRFFEISWQEFTNEDAVTGENVTRAETIPTAMRMDPTYISVYITWMYLIFIYTVPFGGLCVLNTQMFLDVRRSNSRSAMLSSSQKKEMKLAVMLMIVVLVFLICNVLSLVVNILEVFEISYKPLTEISNLLVTINSSANIFIYTIFGEKFKRQLVRYTAKWCPCLKSAMGADSHFKRNQFEFAKSEASGYYGNTTLVQTTMTTATTQLSTTPSPIARSKSQDVMSRSNALGGHSPAGESESSALLLPPPQSSTMQNLAVIPTSGGPFNGHIRKVSVETHESSAEDS